MEPFSIRVLYSLCWFDFSYTTGKRYGGRFDVWKIWSTFEYCCLGHALLMTVLWGEPHMKITNIIVIGLGLMFQFIYFSLSLSLKYVGLLYVCPSR